MTEYRLTKQALWDILELWDESLPGQVRLVACGGTALTLQDLKDSTKDVDFLVPDDEEYRKLVRHIQRLGYRKTTGTGWKTEGSPFIFDLFAGKTVFTTELLESPFEPGLTIPVRKFRGLDVGALNDLDLVISKMFRGAEVDVEDSMTLIRKRGKAFDLEKLKARYKETAQYDTQPEKMMKNLGYLLRECEQGGAGA